MRGSESLISIHSKKEKKVTIKIIIKKNARGEKRDFLVITAVNFSVSVSIWLFFKQMKSMLSILFDEKKIQKSLAVLLKELFCC